MNPPPVLDIRDLSVRFGGLTAVDAVSLTVEAGEIVSLIGPNGAGKTSVFNVVSALLPLTRGSVRINGIEVRRRWDRRVFARILILALICGLAVEVLWDCQALWTRSIVDLYSYQASFPWRRSLDRALGFISGSGPGPLILGMAVSAAAILTMRWGARRTPDLICRSGVARTFQNIRLFPLLTCRENIQIALAVRRSCHPLAAALRLPSVRRAEYQARAAADGLLALAGLSGFEDSIASGLPYGCQRRLEIARALATGPTVLLLDEPAAGMNPVESASLMELIRSIRARGVAVLLIEHDMKVVMGISDRVFVLDHGCLIAQGTPLEVRRNPAVITAYLGEETVSGDRAPGDAATAPGAPP